MGVTFIAPQGTYTSPAKLITKTITENNTYNASDEGANGYSSVTVNVSGGGGGGDIVDIIATFNIPQTPMTGVWNEEAYSYMATMELGAIPPEVLQDDSYDEYYNYTYFTKLGGTVEGVAPDYRGGGTVTIDGVNFAVEVDDIPSKYILTAMSDNTFTATPPDKFIVYKATDDVIDYFYYSLLSAK